MRVALLGGSFDPPHRAHVQVIEYLLKSGRFDEIWVFPSPQNPLKAASAPFEDRLAMCRIAFEKLDPRVRVKDDEGALTGYTIDLIRHLKQHYPKAEFTFVGGSDLKDELPRWKEIEALKKILHFEFLPRPPDPASPFDAISATEVRGKIKKGLPVDAQVPKSVQAYIKNRGLY